MLDGFTEKDVKVFICKQEIGFLTQRIKVKTIEKC